MSEPVKETASKGKVRLVEAAHIFALVGFAIAQPLFDLLGANPTFFVAHRASAWSIVTLAIGLLVIPTALLYALRHLAGMVNPQIGTAVQTLAIGLLLALLALPPLVDSDFRTRWIVSTALAALAVGMLLYRRSNTFRTLLLWASPAPLIFAGLFLFLSPASDLVIGSPEDITSPVVDSDIPVVLVAFDEFALSTLVTPDGEINRARYPNFGRLADLATWYPNATTVHPHTLVAIPSILAGIRPEPGTLPNAQGFPRNVFTLLANGYQVNAMETMTQLCPDEICQPPDQSSQARLWRDTLIVYLHIVTPAPMASRWLPAIDDRWAGFEDGTSRPEADSDSSPALWEIDRTAPLSLWLSGMRPGEAPSLHMLHALLPHTPWRNLPTGQIYENDFFGGIFDGRPGGYWREGAEYTTQGKQRVLLQVGFVDRFVGQMLDRMDEVGILESSLLVVVADHGFSFVPGFSRRGLDLETTAASILPIPMFVKYPHQARGMVDARLAQTPDVLPTIIEVLGIDIDWDLDGRSLLGPEGDHPRPMVVTNDGLVATPEGLFDGARDIANSFYRIFGDGTEIHDMYAMGPHRAMVGTVVSDQAVGTTRHRAAVSGIGRFADVDPHASSVPVRVTGTFEGNVGPLDLALVLDDVIVSVGFTYHLPDEGEWRFSMFIDPVLLRPGCSEPGLYEIGPGTDLHPVTVTNPLTCS